jgi:hypothetical protein
MGSNAQRQNNKILVYLSFLFSIMLGLILFLTIMDQRENIRKETKDAAHIIAAAVHSGILYPMAQGDGEGVKKQLDHLKKGMQGGELFVFGQGKTATYSSEKQKEKSDVLKEVKSTELAEQFRSCCKQVKHLTAFMRNGLKVNPIPPCWNRY